MPEFNFRYPRLLNLDDVAKEKLRFHLDTILLNHQGERGQWMDELTQLKWDYWAEPEEEVKSFPFEGASRMIVPLNAIATEQTLAAVSRRLYGLKQRVIAEPMSDVWLQIKDDIEKYFAWELDEKVKLRPSIESALLEILKLGNGVSRTHFRREIKHGIKLINGEETPFPVIHKQGAHTDSIPVSKFLMPFSSKSPNTAPWCGVEIVAEPYELQLLEDGGMFEVGYVESLKAWALEQSSTEDRVQAEQEEREKRTPSQAERLVIYEIWLSFNVATDQDRAREIVVWYHQTSGKIGAVRYNWLTDLRRPFEIGTYFPVEHRWPGIGIGKQTSMFQREVSAIHRQRLDAGTVSIARVWKTTKFSGVRPDQAIGPGKIITVNDMNDLEPMQHGEIYPSAFSNENMAVIYFQQRSGVNDQILGLEEAGTPGSATSALTRVQEGKKKFDFIFDNIQDFRDRTIMEIARTIHQFGASNVSYFETVKGGDLVKRFLELPDEFIADGLILKIRGSDETSNRILDRQNWTQAAAFLSQYYTAAIQLVQGLGDQKLLQATAIQTLGAITEVTKQILISFDIPNAEKMLLTEIIKQLGFTDIDPNVIAKLLERIAIAGRSSAIEGNGREQVLAPSVEAPQLIRG